MKSFHMVNFKPWNSPPPHLPSQTQNQLTSNSEVVEGITQAMLGFGPISLLSQTHNITLTSNSEVVEGITQAVLGFGPISLPTQTHNVYLTSNSEVVEGVTQAVLGFGP